MMVSEQEPKTAADWMARLQGADDPETLEAYEKWLDSNPDNLASAQELDEVWQLVGALENDPLVQDILAPARPPRASQRSFFLPRFATAALLGLCLVIGLGLTWRAVTAADIYETTGGEQRIVDLADGSRLHLNVATRLEVSLRDETRDVRLVSGQAFFEISPDPSRPFIVTAGDKEITVIGTKFDVMVQGGDTRVTVIEGRVAVTSLGASELDLTQPAPTPEATELLKAPSSAPVIASKTEDGRHRLELTRRDAISWPRNAPPVAVPPTPAIDAAEAWRNGKVVFERTALREAVLELDRYTPVTVRLASPELGSMNVSGVFYIDRLSDLDSLVFALESSLPIVAERRGDQLVLRASD